MKFVTVRDFRSGPGKLWKKLAKEQELVVTSNGHPLGILVSVDESTLESSLQAYRQSRAMLALNKLHRESTRRGIDRTTPEEIEREIKAVRKLPHAGRT
jgi:hypothetical protein